MAYNEQLNDRIREAIADLPDVEEKHMFGGTCFMVNGKMCIGVMKDEMMCRIDPDTMEEALNKPHCRPMTFTGRPMKAYVLVSEEGLKTKKDFGYWINACLEYNVKAKAAKKKKTK